MVIGRRSSLGVGIQLFVVCGVPSKNHVPQFQSEFLTVFFTSNALRFFCGGHQEHSAMCVC